MRMESKSQKQKQIDIHLEGLLLANTWDNNLAGMHFEVFSKRLKDLDQSYLVAIGAPNRYAFNNKGAVSFRKFYYDRIEKRFAWWHDEFQVNGTQPGEGFGMAIATGDVNRDGQEDVLIGSPFYTSKSHAECGRIYFYKKTLNPSLNKISFKLEQVIDGETDFGRFGYAIVNLGNIDSFPGDEYAVSSPTQTQHQTQGAVYILSFLKNKLKIVQNIMPEPFSGVKLFGQSLSRRHADIDNNGYDDLAVGAKRQVLVVNSKPVALDYYNITLLDKTKLSKIKEIDFKTRSGLRKNNHGITVSESFILRVCMTYRGYKLPQKLKFQVQVNMDALKEAAIKKRILTEDSGTDLLLEFDANYSENTCIDTKVYLISEGLTDKISPLKFNLTSKILPTKQDLRLPQPVLTPNLYRSDVSDRSLTLPVRKDCGPDEVCHSNIVILKKYTTPSVILVGKLNQVITLTFNIENQGEAAYELYLNVEYSQSFDFYVAQHGKNKARYTCESVQTHKKQKQKCFIGNPLKKGGRATIEIILRVNDFQDVKFETFRISVESTSRLINSKSSFPVLLNVPVKSMSEISTRSTEAFPDILLVKYSNETRQEKKNQILHSYEFINNGPTDLKSGIIELTIPIKTENGYEIFQRDEYGESLQFYRADGGVCDSFGDMLGLTQRVKCRVENMMVGDVLLFQIAGYVST